MKKKTTYLIPAFVAVFALMFAVATPLAMAEDSEGMHDKKMGQKYKKMSQVNQVGDWSGATELIEVGAFVGSIEITEGADRQALMDDITVSLSVAASGLDVLGGNIGAVINENGDKYLVWTLKSVEIDSVGGTRTLTIYVIDTVDANNTTTVTTVTSLPTPPAVTNSPAVTSEVDQSQRDEKRLDRMANMLDRVKAKMSGSIESTGSSGNADIDAVRSTFVEKLQELRQAIRDGDSEKNSELREELRDLRSELRDLRNNRQ